MKPVTRREVLLLATLVAAGCGRSAQEVAAPPEGGATGTAGARPTSERPTSTTSGGPDGQVPPATP